MPLWSQISSDFEFLSFQIEGTVFHQEQVCFYPRLRTRSMLLLVKDHMDLKRIKWDFIAQKIKDKKTLRVSTHVMEGELPELYLETLNTLIILSDQQQVL